MPWTKTELRVMLPQAKEGQKFPADHQKLWEAWSRFSHSPVEETPPTSPNKLRLLAARTARQFISVG